MLPLVYHTRFSEPQSTPQLRTGTVKYRHTLEHFKTEERLDFKGVSFYPWHYG